MTTEAVSTSPSRRTDDFARRYGDAIDDRVAEALDDYLAEGRLDGAVRLIDHS